MRTIEYYTSKFVPNPAKGISEETRKDHTIPWQLREYTTIGSGNFHAFGVDQGDEGSTFSTCIIELEGGQLINHPVDHCKFTS